MINGRVRIVCVRWTDADGNHHKNPDWLIDRAAINAAFANHFDDGLTVDSEFAVP